jgi:RNA methyltransferase, TrmH family
MQPTTRSAQPHPRTFNDPELKVAGRNACLAVYQHRPADIRRVYVTDATLPSMREALRYCAQQKIAYHVVGNDDLTTIAETVHHDGVMMIVRTHAAPPADRFWQRVQNSDAPIVVLENVKNPHNVGAILRVCAHFGALAAVGAGDTAQLSPAVMRTAEGGAEHCPLFDARVLAPNMAALLERLRSTGYDVIATSSHADIELGREPLPKRCVLLFGSEGDGLSNEAMQAASRTVAIPGSGALESLNVACAASVLLWETQRPRQDIQKNVAATWQPQRDTTPAKPSGPSTRRR